MSSLSCLKIVCSYTAHEEVAAGFLSHLSGPQPGDWHHITIQCVECFIKYFFRFFFQFIIIIHLFLDSDTSWYFLIGCYFLYSLTFYEYINCVCKLISSDNNIGSVLTPVAQWYKHLTDGLLIWDQSHTIDYWVFLIRNEGRKCFV